MKNICLLFALLLLLLSCQQEAKKATNFNLLPAPQELEVTGISNLSAADIQFYHTEENAKLPIKTTLLNTLKATFNVKNAQLFCQIDSSLSLKAEGYTLDITNQQIQLTGKDEAGLFYALMTLGQLLEDAKEQESNLPICHIEDEPKLAYRAIHWDVKHHLEKPSYYYEMLDELASLKINGIIAEMEDKLGYQRQATVASPDAMSIKEWKKLSEYAQERHIEISPLIQGLGHASFILKHDEYKGLRDDPNSDWAFNPLLEETYEVQFDLYRDALEATPNGRFLHIGGDEVHTTGGGKSDLSALELQLKWLNRVCAFAAENNRTPIFWDDMPLKHAGVYRPMFDTKISEVAVDSIWQENESNLTELLDQFPQNCIYMRWNYSSPQTYGNRKAMQWFTQNGLQVMGATAGQTRWGLMPQRESNLDAIRAFANISIDNQADGLLLTLWDDDSPHFELYKRGISFFAESTWTGEQRSKEELKNAYRHRAFSSSLGNTDYAFIDSLEIAAGFWKNAFLKGNARNYLQSNEQATDLLIDFPDKQEKGVWTVKNQDRLTNATRALAISEQVTQRLQSFKDQSIRNNYRIEVYEQVNEMVAFSPKVLLALEKYDNAQNEQTSITAIQEIETLIASFKDKRQKLESVYAKTRILNKPDGYILDQDHHHHLAN
ncbi:MAG: glycoside hydrolase family 20 zincin-like fold domain-containing protein [Bacteroidota bacterium]